MTELEVDFSQSGEQQSIYDMFTVDGEITTGRFLDIGAGEGQKFSNTRGLYEHGWHGVMVEPSAQLFDMLAQRFSGVPTVDCVQAVVTAERRGLTQFFYTPGDFLSTTDIGHLAVWPQVPHHHVWAATVSLAELLDLLGPFAFASIDTEGTSLELLGAYRTHPHWRSLQGICVEVESTEDVARALVIVGDGWEVVAETPNNLVLAWRPG